MPPGAEIELTAAGYARFDAAVAAQFFPGDALVAHCDDEALWLVPLRSTMAGGLLVKQRNAAGDRAVLVLDAFVAPVPAGTFAACWDEERGALRVALPGGSGWVGPGP